MWSLLNYLMDLTIQWPSWAKLETQYIYTKLWSNQTRTNSSRPWKKKSWHMKKEALDSHCNNPGRNSTWLSMGHEAKTEYWHRRRTKVQAWLNAHGGQQVQGVNYWETFAPMVKWTKIRMMITLTIIHWWKSHQLDFMLAYPQANIDGNIYMRLPKVFKLNDGRTHHTHVLKLLKNIYRLNQAGWVWNKHLHWGLFDLGYSES